MKRRMIAMLLSAAMLVSLFLTPGLAAEVSFTDTSGHWAEKAIASAVEKGLFQGVEKNRFAPNEEMTRAMFVIVLGRFAEGMGAVITGKSTFSDVPATSYYAPYVAWAADKGIVTGTRVDQFSPRDSVTREQMCALFIRFLTMIGYPVPTGSSLTFADRATFHGYSVAPVQSAVALGLFEGMNSADGLVFKPREGATRAEAATVFLRLADLSGIKNLDLSRLPSSSGTEQKPAEPVISDPVMKKEAEIAGYLTTVLNNYDNMEYLGTTDQAVRSCMDRVMGCLRGALRDRNSGIPLTKENVALRYQGTMDEMKQVYHGMSEAQKDQVINIAVRLESIAHLRILCEYFDISIL